MCSSQRQRTVVFWGVLLSLTAHIGRGDPTASNSRQGQAGSTREQSEVHPGALFDGPKPDEPFKTRGFVVAGPEQKKQLGVCYGPYRKGQQPDGTVRPSDEQLKEDLHLLARHWTIVRLYSSVEFAERLLALIRDERLPLRVVLGAWLGSESASSDDGQAAEAAQLTIAANQREIETAIRLANAYPEIVVVVCVGNETQVDWSPHRLVPERLLEYIRTVRAKTKVPVTTADDQVYWLTPASRAIAAEIDFITCHIHPLWHGQQLADAMKYLSEQYDQVRMVHPERTIIIGETGWATKMHPVGLQAELIKGKTGEAEQKAFYDELRKWATARGVTTLHFEAFDEPWKGGEHPDEVEKHWGLYHVDRTPKLALSADEQP